MFARRKLFRTQALQHYAQNKQKDVLPSFVAPPVFLFLWILLLLSVVAVAFAWQERIPTYVQSTGVILEQQGEPATVLLFVPISSGANIRSGQTVSLQANTTGQQFTARVTSVDADAITPDAARAQYQLTGDTLFMITQPSLVVHLAITGQQATQAFDRLSVTGLIQVGSRSLLSLLPDLVKNAFGG